MLNIESYSVEYISGAQPSKIWRPRFDKVWLIRYAYAQHDDTSARVTTWYWGLGDERSIQAAYQGVSLAAAVKNVLGVGDGSTAGVLKQSPDLVASNEVYPGVFITALGTNKNFYSGIVYEEVDAIEYYGRFRPWPRHP